MAAQACWRSLCTAAQGRALASAALIRAAATRPKAGLGHAPAAPNFGGCRRWRSTRGVLLVRDPLSAWGSTGSMNTAALLDAIARAERARTGDHRALWERLSCRAQALLPDFTASELCRVLFAFHRVRCRDEGLLRASCEALLAGDRPAQGLLANDVALIFKALSKHGFHHPGAMHFLLQQAAVELPRTTAADASQLLAAVLRLDVGYLLSRHNLDGRPVSSDDLLEALLKVAKEGVSDRYLPPADLTNLCVAAALLPPVEQGAQLLKAVARSLERPSTASAIQPRELVRRLHAIGTFDKKLRQEADRTQTIRTVAARLGPLGLAPVCQAVGRVLAPRVSELDADATVRACEALALALSAVPLHGDIDARAQALAAMAEYFAPALALLCQRLPSLDLPSRHRVQVAAALALSVLEPGQGAGCIEAPGPTATVANSLLQRLNASASVPQLQCQDGKEASSCI